MRNKYRLGILTSLFFLCIGFSTQAQKTLQHDSESERWQSAVEKFQNKNFGAAWHEFADYLELEPQSHSCRKAQAEFYMAWCSIELFRPDAEEEMQAFIRNHPESNQLQAAYFQLGRQQYRNKKYKEALLWFNKVDVYQLNHNDLPEYQFKMGYSYFMRKDYEQAKKHFYEIIEVSGEYNAPANYYYAHIAYLDHKYQTALLGFEKLVTNKTFAPIVPYYITQIYYLQEKYSQLLAYAIPLLEDVTVSRRAEIAKMIGLSHYQLKEYQKAIPFLERGKESLTRGDRFAYGYCLYKQQEFEKAITQFERVGGEEDEMLQIASYCLADCYLKTGNKSGAKVAFASTARMDFDKNMQQDALFNFAKLTYELSYSPFNETIKAFDEYLQKYPDSNRNDEAYDYLVKVYMTTKNYGDALASMDKIKNKTPQIKRAYQRVSWLRGLEWMKQLKYPEAVKSFDASLQYQIYNSKIAAECLYWKAEAKYRVQDFEEAIVLYKKFLLASGVGASVYFGRAYYNIASAYFEMDKYENASDWYRKFVNQATIEDRYVWDAYNRIGDCFFLDREYQKAAEFYAKAANGAKWDADYAIYQQAFVLGLLNQPKEKVSLLEKLKNTYPNSEYTDDALYELARAKVKLGDQRSAIKMYKELVDNNPQSSYAAKALVQLGLMNYNLKDYQQAIHYYKQVVMKYPQSEEKKSAFTGLKNVYIDLNQVDDYFAFAESFDGGVRVRSSEKDSLSYISAERLYMNGESERGTKAFSQYLANFPNGMFCLNAQFYKADAALNQKKYEEALTGFEEVLKQSDNLFTEKALLAASQLNYRKGNFVAAKSQFLRLKQSSEIPEHIRIAKIGYMRTAYELNDFQVCIDAAKEVLNLPKVQEEIVREATYKQAKSYLALKESVKALADLKSLTIETQSTEGAEAKFLLAKLYFDKAKYDLSEKEINQFIEMNSPHQYWLAESFLLLSDVYLQKGDRFQARYTLQSIIDNYGVKDDDILLRTQKKLNVLLQEEKQNEEKIQKKEIELPFEGSDPDENKKLFEDTKKKSDSLGVDEERLMLKEMLKKEDINAK
ncbi:tetratricopeptide repeat protein [Ancylomarina longa]|uniref:Outer membrane protein assembly factor BamD n=1 Tax=Ancylomarina longa TaxID=2487017 RepID=A0A434AUV2_9BACT|nr:tetratricopeptide repeat protein [Ancylomarina longa]RUT78240.1 outer membrane protein assembly factor BamD [Ancylomarina longa]